KARGKILLQLVCNKRVSPTLALLPAESVFRGRLGTAGFAVAADLGARDGDLDAAISLDLALELLEQPALEFAYPSAAQAGNVDMIARAMTFVVVLVPADVQQVELVNQTMALQQVERAIDRDAVHPRIHPPRASQDGAGVEMSLGTIHHFEQHATLARQAHAALFESGLEAPGPGVGIDALAR